ncbi:MAG: restriction endonuclease subunit S [Chloroflexota bacterium]
MYDSQVQWLGMIPKHWSIIQSRRLFEQRRERMRPGDEQLTASQKYGVIPQSKFMRLENQKVMQVFTGADILKHVEPNDFVISMRSFQGGLEWCGYSGCVSSAYVGITPIKHVQSAFFKYLFKSKPYIQALQSTSNLVRDGQALRYQNFAQVPLPLISEQEQTQIAKFLDYETAKIDALIEKQEQLIALLKEKRQAVISHAVTKGLNPAAPMRDSGIEWLGQVPAHWKVSALKHVASTKNGYGFSSADFVGEGVPFIRAGNIKRYSITSPKIFLPTEIVARFERLRLKPGEVLISMVGSDPSVKESAVGQVGVVPSGLTGAVPNQNVVILRESAGQMTKRFLFHSLCSSAYRNHLDVFSHKLANQSIISSSLIVAARVCIPPTAEQDSITQYLDARLPKFDSTIEAANTTITLLQERRTALISAAVTGKIDVRGWQPPQSQSEKEAA